MLKLGLTGNICAGKSQVEKMLEDKKYKVIDLDVIAHKLLENNQQIKDHFKTLDRKKIADIVFSNSSEKKYLENILHPMLYNYVLDEFKKDYEKIVISGALIYEAGFSELFDKIIFVDAPYNLRLERLMKRNNLTIEEAKKRLDVQSSEYKTKADYVIENTSTLEDLAHAINLIL